MTHRPSEARVPLRTTRSDARAPRWRTTSAYARTTAVRTSTAATTASASSPVRPPRQRFRFGWWPGSKRKPRTASLASPRPLVLRGCRSQRWLGDELEAVRNENVDGARSETQRTLMSAAFVDKSDQFRDSRTAVLYALAGDERGAGGRSSTLTCEAFDPFRARGPSEPRSRRRPCPRSRGPSPYRP